MQTKTVDLYSILAASGINPLRDGSYTKPLYAAQRSMDGLTHYYDDDTLRYFNARVHRAEVVARVALVTLESTKHNDEPRRYRVTVHDLTGTVINERRDVDDMLPTLRAAEKEYREAIAAIDPVKVLANAITRERAQALRYLAQLSQAQKRMRRKTETEYVVQGDYGQGWEDVTTEEKIGEAMARLREYRDNENAEFRLVTRRVKLEVVA